MIRPCIKARGALLLAPQTARTQFNTPHLDVALRV